MAPHDPNQLPRNVREPDGNLPGEDLADDDDDVDDASGDDDSDSGDYVNSGDSENEPDDDDRQARLTWLRRRHRQLLRRREVEERLLEREVMLRDQVVRAVEIMESRVQELRVQRNLDLAESEALETGSPADAGRDGVGDPVSSSGHLAIDVSQSEEGKVTEGAKEVDTEHE